MVMLMYKHGKYSDHFLEQVLSLFSFSRLQGFQRIGSPRIEEQSKNIG